MGTIADSILAFVSEQERRRQDVERAEAQQQSLEVTQLADHPGWKRLVDHLTTAIELLHSKYDDGDELSAQERAFLRLARRVKEGPSFLMEDAQAIIAATNR